MYSLIYIVNTYYAINKQNNWAAHEFLVLIALTPSKGSGQFSHNSSLVVTFADWK